MSDAFLAAMRHAKPVESRKVTPAEVDTEIARIEKGVDQGEASGKVDLTRSRDNADAIHVRPFDLERKPDLLFGVLIRPNVAHQGPQERLQQPMFEVLRV